MADRDRRRRGGPSAKARPEPRTILWDETPESAPAPPGPEEIPAEPAPDQNGSGLPPPDPTDAADS